MAGARTVTPKAKCCQDGPRCKRCPVVLKRLAEQGLAKRKDGRYVLAKTVPKKRVKAARAR